MNKMVLIFGIVLFIVGCIPIAAYLIFRFSPKSTARTSAILRRTKHNKNYILTDIRNRSKFVKHYTTCTYIYVANKKAYKVKDALIGTPKQAVYSLPIVYLKRFPRFYYINDKNGLGKGKFIIYSLLPLAIAVLSIILGISILLKF